MQLISVDDHLIEHPRMWADRLPAKYQELGPRIVEVPRAKGGPPSQVWEYQGKTYPQIGLNAVAGKKPEEYGIDPSRFDEMLPGCYDPVQRLGRHGPRRRRGGAVLSVVSPVRRHGVPGGRGPRRGAGLRDRHTTTSCSTSGAPPPRTDTSRW